MATTQYYAWNNAGRPITPCRPVREIVERMKVAYPEAAKQHLFSWYADDAHYMANRPQDHTPYSYTPWPISPNPYPYVFATDIMHRPDLGVDCNKLFAYWLAEARAGRMPWLKYMIWQAKIYDVRNGWAAGKASGHFDHIHISTRTDHIETSLGTWSLVPGVVTQQEEGMRLVVSPSKTVWLFPDDLSNGKPVAIPLLDLNKINAWRATGVPQVSSSVEPTPQYFFITEVNAPWPFPDPVELDDDQFEALLAKVEAAAEAGAEAGVVASVDDIADAVVDEERDRLAE